MIKTLLECAQADTPLFAAECVRWPITIHVPEAKNRAHADVLIQDANSPAPASGFLSLQFASLEAARDGYRVIRENLEKQSANLFPEPMDRFAALHNTCVSAHKALDHIAYPFTTKAIDLLGGDLKAVIHPNRHDDGIATPPYSYTATLHCAGDPSVGIGSWEGTPPMVGTTAREAASRLEGFCEFMHPLYLHQANLFQYAPSGSAAEADAERLLEHFCSNDALRAFEMQGKLARDYDLAVAQEPVRHIDGEGLRTTVAYAIVDESVAGHQTLLGPWETSLDRLEQQLHSDNEKMLGKDYIDAFVRSYEACALWSTSTGEDVDLHLDDQYDSDDIDPDSRLAMRKDCLAFIRENTNDLRNIDAEQAGHDFWLTRNRHGAGFWDRGLGEVGRRLTESAQIMGAIELYAGDDNKIYAAGHEPRQIPTP